MPNLDDLNKQANERFDKIKSSHWIGNLFIQSSVPINERTKIEANKLQEMLDESESIAIPVKDIDASINISMMEAIDALKLAPNLSIAVSYLITAMNKDSRFNLEKAIEYIEREIRNGKTI